MSQAGRNPDGGCWAHNSGVYREPAYRWSLAGGNVVDLCASWSWRAFPLLTRQSPGATMQAAPPANPNPGSAP